MLVRFHEAHRRVQRVMKLHGGAPAVIEQCCAAFKSLALTGANKQYIYFLLMWSSRAQGGACADWRP